MATQIVCRHCQKVLGISGEPPEYCAYCGKALADSTVTAAPSPSTGTFDANTATLPPREGGATHGRSGFAPQIVGKYRLIRRLGSGGMGTVHEAEHSETGRRVALKLISRELAASKDSMQRFRQEGRLASAIAHPRCVFVFAADEADGQSYIVMELMPGDTLIDLIDRKGPLSPSEGIAKILDVIDGLLEAHRLEVIHRDVKPSNCFLEPDGRVKVGDFGLAKSLVSRNKANLTRTGAFLGTPHFASPEQVRGEPLDPQTDVYSVSATLYYLLAGKPPFSGTDAAATLARIVCDPPPSLRSLRPELPVALDRVVLKGLERDRQRRFPDLHEFRAALVALLPREMSSGGMAVRLAAFIADTILVLFVLGALKSLIRGGAELVWEQAPAVFGILVAEAVAALLWILYFAIGEAVWNGSAGKRWLRLRVRARDGAERPSLRQVLTRTAIAFGVFQLGWLAMPAILFACGVDIVTGPWRVFLAWGWFGVGALLAVSTMRKRTGYRGLHEILSGTRVVALPWPKRRAKPLSVLGWVLYLKRSGRLTRDAGGSASLPDQMGGFTIRGAMRWTPAEKVLLGEDSSLGRKVVICARPHGQPDLDPKRLKIDRTTRVRWIGSGSEKDLHWDAFLAPSGCPLPELIASEKRLPWSEVRPILEQLADELVAAMADGTLPQNLNCDQVWVQQNGQVQLVDMPAEAPMADAGSESANDRCLSLLRQVTMLALEGRVPAAGEALQPIRAPMPEHVQQILNRLVGVHDPYPSVDQLQADLVATADQPMEVGSANRGAQLALQTALLLPGLVLMFLAGVLLPDLLGGEDTVTGPGKSNLYDLVAWSTIGAAIVWPLLWVCWAFIARGGLSYSMMGISLVDSAGHPAPRWRCALRALIIWAPIMLLLFSTYWSPSWVDNTESPAMFRLGWLSYWAIIAAVLAMYLLRALMSPQRALHDTMADIHLVPR